MKVFRNYIIIIWGLLVAVACSYEFPEIDSPGQQNLGEIDNSKVVVIGDGYMAGVMDGALYNKGQQNSLGAIIYSHLNVSDSATYNQPAINSENGYNLFIQNQNNIHGRWVNNFEGLYDETPELVLTAGNEITSFNGDLTNIDDLSVPLLKINDLQGDKLNQNPFFNRISGNPSENYISLINKKDPSFIICWIGMRDFLDFAVGGAEVEDLLTPENEFYTRYEHLISGLLEGSELKIGIGNLISVTDLPFFYLKQYNFITLDNSAKARAQARYSAFNSAVAAHNVGKPDEELRPFISFEDNGATLYPQPIVVIDNNLPDAFYPDGSPLEKFRQLKNGDLALFSISDEMVANGFGSHIPLPEEYYLSEAEVQLINEQINSYNQIINEVADKYSQRTVVVDVNSEVQKISDSSKFDAWGIPSKDTVYYDSGVPIRADISMNSIFSLDAVYFNQRGNAFIANVFLKSINEKFSANIPLATINNYVGNVYVFDY